MRVNNGGFDDRPIDHDISLVQSDFQMDSITYDTSYNSGGQLVLSERLHQTWNFVVENNGLVDVEEVTISLNMLSDNSSNIFLPKSFNEVISVGASMEFSIVESYSRPPNDVPVIISIYGDYIDANCNDNRMLVQNVFTSTIDQDEIEFTIYPNPVYDHLHVVFDGGQRFTILDLSGTEVKSGNIDKSPIDVSSLSAGMYIIKVDNKDGEVRTQKFIKHK